MESLIVPGEFLVHPPSGDQIIGRVVQMHRERYVVQSFKDEYDAEITGNMRYSANSMEDFPAVGDWVTLTPYEENFAIIHQILPRRSLLKRSAVAREGEVQVIAANIDTALLVQSVDQNFNLNRLERYLALVHDARIQPVVLITKTDLADATRLEEINESLTQRLPEIQVLYLSNVSGDGIEDIRSLMESGKTYCLLGSSGVGKSTLVNMLTGSKVMETGHISDSTGKGRHVTSHRELFVLDNGALLIDNPGMREVGITDAAGGIAITFDRIQELSAQCRYPDCTHSSEAGCAVILAVEAGEIELAVYENYLRMERERAHFESSAYEKRKKEKSFGRIMKNYKKDMKRNMDS
ncbi:MAG: ribosome small subunit-dependent GTPase A [Bacteroidales bacterium]